MKQEVSLSYRAMFCRSNAQLRRAKKVCELVQENKKGLQSFLTNFGESLVVDELEALQEARIFESDLRARVWFSYLFETITKCEAQSVALKVDAIRSTAAFAEAIESSEDGADRTLLDRALVSEDGHQRRQSDVGKLRGASCLFDII